MDRNMFITTLKNNFLYNAGSELNEHTNHYETPFRGYDAATGRFTGVDPMAAKYASLTPYNYAFNDPVSYNDPSGADPIQDMLDNMGRSRRGYTGSSYGSYSYYWEMDGSGGGISRHGNTFVINWGAGEHGAHWNSNGNSFLFASQEQALAYGMAYQDRHDSWEHTYYGSEQATLFGYFAANHNGGTLLSPEAVNYHIQKYQQSKVNSMIAGMVSGQVPIFNLNLTWEIMLNPALADYFQTQNGGNVYAEISNSFNEMKYDYMAVKNVGANAMFNMIGHYSVNEIDGKYYFNASAAGTTPAKTQGDVAFLGSAQVMVNGKAVNNNPFVLRDGYNAAYPSGFQKIGAVSFELPTSGNVIINLNFSYHIVFGLQGNRHSAVMTIPVHIRQIGLPRN